MRLPNRRQRKRAIDSTEGAKPKVATESIRNEVNLCAQTRVQQETHPRKQPALHPTKAGRFQARRLQKKRPQDEAQKPVKQVASTYSA